MSDSTTHSELSRSEGNASSWINSLPQETDWLQSQDVYDSFKTQTKIPALMGEFEELIQVNPDLYTAYCERELTPYARVGYKKIQVLRPVLSVFESTKYGDLTLDDFDHRPTPEIESFIRHLHANVPRPEDREDWKEMESVPPPLRPGEGYVHYIDEPSGEFLGRYKRLLSYGANILCLTTEEMQDHVRRVEEATVCETVLAPGHLVEAENMDYLQQQAASAQRRSSHKK
ncbi:hypothetical protein BGZ83_002579 [Gryganskiella cystojenkinii]|nr:hypothetical protein BGZ83_002579 [Gryganskiella cystojenkinii]